MAAPTRTFLSRTCQGENQKTVIRLMPLLAGIAGTLALLLPSVIDLSRPYQMDNAEGVVLMSAHQILSGISPYGNPHVFPVTLSPYGPLFYAAVAKLIGQFGIGFFWPRLLVFACTLACGACVGHLAAKWTSDRLVGTGFGLLFLTAPLVQNWSAILRADIVALFLCLVGLCVFEKRSIYSVPLFTAALFVKYSFIAAPVACVVALLLQKQRKRALSFVALTVALAALSFAVCQWWSGGWFFFHMFQSHPDPFSLSKLRDTFVVLLRTEIVPIALSAVFIVSSGPEARLPKIYLAAAAMVALACGKIGGNTNYMLETVAALTLAAACGYKHMIDAASRRWQFIAAAGLLMLLTFSLAMRVTWFRSTAPSAYAGCPEAYGLIAAERDMSILSENVGALALAGKPALVSDPFMFRQLVGAGTLSDKPLVDLMREQKVDVVLLGNDMEFYASHRSYRWPPELLEAVRKNYRVSRRFQCLDASVAFEPNRPE